MGFSLFKSKVKGPKRFNYDPKFLDEDKQDLQNRKRAIERKVQEEKGELVDDYIPTRNIKFDSRAKKKNNFVSKSKKTSNITLIIILIILFYGFGYMMDKMDHFEGFFDKWLNK